MVWFCLWEDLSWFRASLRLVRWQMDRLLSADQRICCGAPGPRPPAPGRGERHVGVQLSDGLRCNWCLGQASVAALPSAAPPGEQNLHAIHGEVSRSTSTGRGHVKVPHLLWEKEIWKLNSADSFADLMKAKSGSRSKHSPARSRSRDPNWIPKRPSQAGCPAPKYLGFCTF